MIIIIEVLPFTLLNLLFFQIEARFGTICRPYLWPDFQATMKSGPFTESLWAYPFFCLFRYVFPWKWNSCLYSFFWEKTSVVYGLVNVPLLKVGMTRCESTAVTTISVSFCTNASSTQRPWLTLLIISCLETLLCEFEISHKGKNSYSPFCIYSFPRAFLPLPLWPIIL